MLVPGVQKNDFYDFFVIFLRKNPEYENLEWDDDSGNLEWADGNPGISSEPTETRKTGSLASSKINFLAARNDSWGSQKLPGRRRLTRDSRNRRLTRDSQARRLTRGSRISGFFFFRKNHFFYRKIDIWQPGEAWRSGTHPGEPKKGRLFVRPKNPQFLKTMIFLFSTEIFSPTLNDFWDLAT